jgi:hypothetical protein
MANAATDTWSDTRTLERPEKRLFLPIEAVKVAGWPLEGNSTGVVVELREVGRVRMFLQEHVNESFSARRQQLVDEARADPGAFDKREALLEFDDRYRLINYNIAARRVTLGKIIMLHVDTDPTRAPDVFLQASYQTIDVMNMQLRNARLIRSEWSLVPLIPF